MYKNKVVVTGISVCSPNGMGNSDFENNILAGISGCSYIDSFKVPNTCSRTAGIINQFEPDTLFSMDNARNYNLNKKNRMQLLAEFCIAEAIKGANLKIGNNNEIALYLSTAIGPLSSMEYCYIKSKIDNKFKNSGTIFSFYNMSKILSKKFNLQGHNLIIPTGCVGGCDAITYSINKIRQGEINCAVVGSVEAPITPLVVNAFGKINATSSRNCPPGEASCPYDFNRDGFVLAEGCGILILESETSALARNAKILAEIKGAASINNCFHMTDIDINGEYIAQSSQLAMSDAKVGLHQIDYINAHGSSTVQNDVAEANAFAKIFGKNLQNIPVTSIKSQIGHALAAANSIELVSAVQTLNNQKIPPTINVKNQDKKCQIALVKDNYINHNINNILKTSSGFSGIHTSIILGKYRHQGASI